MSKNFNHTALSPVPSENNDSLVQILLDQGTGLNKAPALHVASKKGIKRRIYYLLDQGADDYVRGDYSNTILRSMSDIGHEKIVQMLDRGPKISTLGTLAHTTRKHSTALGYAQSTRQADVVQPLLKQGADINHDNNSKTICYILTRGGTKIEQAL